MSFFGIPPGVAGAALSGCLMERADRIAKLEEVLTHQQLLVEQLNEIVIELRTNVERLQSRIERQQLQIKHLESRSRDDEIPDEKPPHY